MTQYYEPIEITESTPEPSDGAEFFLTDKDDDYSTVATVTEDGWFLPGYESEFFWEEIRDKHIGWRIQSLAAHDAQIRAEAMELTDEERDLMLKSALDFTETDDAQEVDEMIAAIIGSVVEHRKEQK